MAKGNLEYHYSSSITSDVSKEMMSSVRQGQDPFAVVIACSDSRVVPEKIFNAEIGDIFVIQGAGNLVCDVALGSVEYAITNLGTKLVVVLGHSGCGAIRAALETEGPGRDTITRTVKAAIGGETDRERATKLNMIAGFRNVMSNETFRRMAAEEGVGVVCGYYKVSLGLVDFLSKRSMMRYDPGLDLSAYVELSGGEIPTNI